MSDMKTFTVRDLDRRPSDVLNACDSEGAVRIRRRDGRSYTLRSDLNGSFSWGEWLAERQRKSKELFRKPLTKKEAREFDRLIRSDRE